MGALRNYFTGLAKKCGIDLENVLVKFEYKKDVGVVAKQGSHSSMTVNYIMPHFTNEVLSPSRIQETVKLTKDELCFLTREDLAPYDAIAIAAQESEYDLMKVLRDIVSHEDFVALAASVTIRRFELLGQGQRAMEFKTALKRRFKERGNRILVFYSTGLLEDILGFMLRWITYAGTYSDRIRVRELWDRCLEGMDYAIFVNAGMAIEGIVSRLEQGFHIEGLPVMLVFGRTEPITAKIEKALKNFQLAEEARQLERLGYQIEKQEYEVGDHNVMVVKISVTAKLPANGCD